MKLTPKQKKFCEYYIQTGNAAEAARQAGYSEKTAYSIGAENLTKPDISQYIAERMAAREKNLVADSDEVMRFYTAVMRGTAKDPQGVGVSFSERLKAADALMKRYNIIGDNLSTGAHLSNMQALADMLRHPVPNRNIHDFETREDDPLTAAVKEELQRIGPDAGSPDGPAGGK